MRPADFTVENLIRTVDEWSDKVAGVLGSLEDPAGSLIILMVGIAIIIAGWKWYRGRDCRREDPSPGIEEIPYTDSPFVETNWGAMVGLLCFSLCRCGNSTTGH